MVNIMAVISASVPVLLILASLQLVLVHEWFILHCLSAGERMHTQALMYSQLQYASEDSFLQQRTPLWNDRFELHARPLPANQRARIQSHSDTINFCYLECFLLWERTCFLSLYQFTNTSAMAATVRQNETGDITGIVWIEPEWKERES